MTEAAQETKRLLVVDDELSITKLLKALLTRAKYQVVTCNSGDEALRSLAQGKAFDLLITDSIMPVMSGIDLVKTVRGNPTFQEIPILMLTRKGERADVQNALEAGVTDYVLKPIDEHLLIDKVAHTLKKHDDVNRLREVAIHGADSIARIHLDVRIVSLRETGMVIRFHIDPPAEKLFVLDAPIFKKIGIPTPILRMSSCTHHASQSSQEFKDFPYEAEFAFQGIGEKDLKKIRAWLQNQEIQRKK